MALWRTSTGKERWVKTSWIRWAAGIVSEALRTFARAAAKALVREARVDFFLEHLTRDAAELVGEEVVETGRHAGRAIRALGRTSDGRGVAAIDETEADPGSLAEELAALRALQAA